MPCECDVTVEHILIECGGIAEVWQRYYGAENMTNIPENHCFRYLLVGDSTVS